MLSGRRAVAENRRRSDKLEGNGGEESLWAKRINREQKSKKIGHHTAVRYCLEWFAQRPITCTDSTAVHGSYIASSWDFYKPDLTSEYVCPPLIPTFLPFYCPTCLTSQYLARTKTLHTDMHSPSSTGPSPSSPTSAPSTPPTTRTLKKPPSPAPAPPRN